VNPRFEYQRLRLIEAQPCYAVYVSNRLIASLWNAQHLADVNGVGRADTILRSYGADRTTVLE
jgi:hypothetical protein